MDDIYTKISEVMLWYDEHSYIMNPDELLAKRDELAILSFRLAEIVGDTKTDYNNAYFIKVINIARDKQALLENNMAYNRAEVQALLENELYHKDAIVKESIAYKNDVLLKQINVIIGSMNQRISYAIKEKHNSAYTHNAITRK